MLLLSIDKVTPGMVPAERIYDIKNSIKDCEIRRVRLIDTKMKVIQAFQSFIDQYLSQCQPSRRSSFKLIVNTILAGILADKCILKHLAALIGYDFLTFCHCVNVCGLSIVTGQKLGLEDEKLRELSLGAILHDLGKLAIPKTILNKPASLGIKEWQLVKKHPLISYQIIKTENILPERVAQITYEHHENYDGSGYPLGLSGREINVLSRIVAIADVYDAVTTPRTYRNALSPHEAYNELEISKNTRLDPAIVDAFWT